VTTLDFEMGSCSGPKKYAAPDARIPFAADRCLERIRLPPHADAANFTHVKGVRVAAYFQL